MNTLTIFPWPSSYREFCDRNPEITDLGDQLYAMDQEVSLWKATSPEVDLIRAWLNANEESYRRMLDFQLKAGREIIKLDSWPKVGEYEIPEELMLVR